MKKLSVLIALALVLTIGGAYATWTYYTTVPAAQSGVVTIDLEASEQVAAGTLNVVVSGDAKLTIDDIHGTYVPGFESVGTITVTFTANEKATSEILTNGIELPIAIASNKGVITVNDSANGLVIGTKNSDKAIKWTGSDGTFTCEIPVATIASHLTINGGSKLDTIAKYNEFQTNLGNDAKITVTIGG